jgi:hypothetical protein
MILPWLATFLFGCAVFAIGKIFQRAERLAAKLKQAEKEAAIERESVLKIQAQLQRVQEEQLDQGIMAAMGGQQGQRTGRYVQ